MRKSPGPCHGCVLWSGPAAPHILHLGSQGEVNDYLPFKRVVLLTEEPPPTPSRHEARESTERDRAGCSNGRQNFLQLSGRSQ